MVMMMIVVVCFSITSARFLGKCEDQLTHILRTFAQLTGF